MSSDKKQKLRENGITENTIYYWGYMYDLGVTYIVPFLKKMKIFKEGDSVAEIGSAEGGGLHAFLDNGSNLALGTDIAKLRLKEGEAISKIIGYNIEYHYHDIINEEPYPQWAEKYDLVILRDVIEHLDNPEIAIRNIKKIIKPGGFLYITFPPYKSPFGGHQHTLAGNFITKIPWLHILPKSLFFKLIKSGRPQDIEEVERLKDLQFSPEKMEYVAKKAGYKLFMVDFYLIRPVYKMKFGFNPIRMRIGTKNKFIRNYFCLEASYILQSI